jgi:hypothetical protein
MNNLALFATHSIFLTKEESLRVIEGQTISTLGHCVPVWIDAKSGKTTEPAEEIFCQYMIHNSQEPEVKIMNRKGYEIFIPRCSEWSPPPSCEYEKISIWPSEDRMTMMKELDKWWFLNPKPVDVSNLNNGYLRFETKKTQEGKNKHHEQHVVEIAFWCRLIDSLAT